MYPENVITSLLQQIGTLWSKLIKMYPENVITSLLQQIDTLWS